MAKISVALECAKMSFESGCEFNRDDFYNSRSYQKYLEYKEMGPVGFYEKFKDKLDFDPDYIAEYGNSDD